jgi:hypothetical protein
VCSALCVKEIVAGGWMCEVGWKLGFGWDCDCCEVQHTPDGLAQLIFAALVSLRWAAFWIIWLLLRCMPAGVEAVLLTSPAALWVLTPGVPGRLLLPSRSPPSACVGPSSARATLEGHRTRRESPPSVPPLRPLPRSLSLSLTLNSSWSQVRYGVVL